MSRLHNPYRATSDLDAVDRLHGDERPALELLLATDATPSGPAGAEIETELGTVRVDLLSVSDTEVDDLPDDPTDRLHVLSHAWAAATASDLLLTATGIDPMAVAVAQPGALIAMKLQSIMNRGVDKEGTDLLDIVRLTLDRETGPTSRDQLERADRQLRADALLHSERWFRETARRSLSKIRAVPEGRGVELDDLDLVGELLAGALDG